MPTDTTQKDSRLIHLDALRGFIMILMAIDHASYFIAHKHSAEFWGMPLPQYESSLAFLTRFITHFCAPGFFFLMGAGIVLFVSARRQLGWTDSAIRNHLIVRGLLLIVIQLFIEAPAWLLGPAGDTAQSPGGGSPFYLYFGVLYGLGAAMIVCAFLLKLDSKILIGLSAAGVLITQLLIPSADKVNTLYSPLVRLLLIAGHTNIVDVRYPLIPWLAITLFGIVFGRWAAANSASASIRAMIIGISFLFLFWFVRTANGFGNIHPLDGSNWIDFLNVTKYPPSLSYILLTLGVDLILLALFSAMSGLIKRWGKPLLVFGQSALFFYIIHLYLYGLMGKFLAPSNGVPIAWMYLYWAFGLILLYPACVWYKNFKAKTSPTSLWRLF